MFKQIMNIFYKQNNTRNNLLLDYDNGPFKVIRKDGTTIIEFDHYLDAFDFSLKLNDLYKENNIKDNTRVVSG